MSLDNVVQPFDMAYEEQRDVLERLINYVVFERGENLKEFLDLYMPSSFRAITDYTNPKVNWASGERLYEMLREDIGDFKLSKTDNSSYDRFMCEHIASVYTYLHFKAGVSANSIYERIPFDVVKESVYPASYWGSEIECAKLAENYGLKLMSDEEAFDVFLSSSIYDNQVYGRVDLSS